MYTYAATDINAVYDKYRRVAFKLTIGANSVVIPIWRTVKKRDILSFLTLVGLVNDNYLRGKSIHMKKILFLLVSFSLILAGCSDSGEQNATGEAKVDTTVQAMTAQFGAEEQEVLVPADTANIMIKSYLNSINYAQNDSSLKSIIVNADALRGYLTGSEGQRIHKLKIMFAHTMDYISSGGQNQYAYYNSGELTVVLAGYDDNGNYIFVNNKAMDRTLPCPANCPTAGTAAQDTFTIN